MPLSMRKAFVCLMFASLASMARAQAPVRAGGEFRVNVQTTGGQGDVAATADATGRFVVVWSSEGQDGSGYAVVGRRFDGAGAPLGGEFVVNGYTTGIQTDSSVAAGPDGRFMVTWSSQGQDGSGYGVFGRAYRASGEPAGPEFAVSQTTGLGQAGSHVAAIPGGFVVVWQGYIGPRQIFARVYTLNGAPVSPEFQVSVPDSGNDDHLRPSVAGLPNGAYVITWWQSHSTPAVGGRILYRVYDTGGPLGPQQPAAPDDPQYHYLEAPDVLVRADGSFTLAWGHVSCWVGDGVACSELGVEARDYDPVGAPVGAVYRVDQAPHSLTEDPRLAISSRGSQWGAWTSAGGDICIPPGFCGPPYEGQDGSGTAVYARRFGPVLPGPEFQANTYTTGLQATPAVAVDPFGNALIAWTSQNQDGSSYGVYAQRFGGLLPVAVDVDTAGNHVWEPGETVDLRPSWRNATGGSQSFSGSIAGLTGPPIASYTITDGTGSYGITANNTTAPCVDCYGVAVTVPATRPTHWDASVLETLSPGSQGQQVRWPLHIGNSFTDVPASNPFYRFIETLLHRGVSGGCTTTSYCPAEVTTRDAMAAFVLVAREGAGYTPPACVPPNIFADLPETNPFCRFVEELANRGVVSGCGDGNYCASAPVTREQLAVFVLRTLDPALDPPACAPPNLFADLPETSPFCRWVEELANRGVVAGCGGGNYCGGAPVTREQMAVFLGVTFGLTLYGV